MPFTTWSDLKTKMENDMADLSWRYKKYETGDGTVVEYNTFSEFKSAYDHVCTMVAIEGGVACGRTSARGMGRF